MTTTYSYCTRCSNAIAIAGLSNSLCPVHGWISSSLVTSVQPKSTQAKSTQGGNSAPETSAAVALPLKSVALPTVNPVVPQPDQLPKPAVIDPQQLDLFGGAA